MKAYLKNYKTKFVITNKNKKLIINKIKKVL